MEKGPKITREQQLYNSIKAILDVHSVVGEGVDRRLKENPDIVKEIRERGKNKPAIESASDS